MSTINNEIFSGNRFEFGKNWTNFLETLNDEKITKAMKSLQEMLKLNDFSGLRFLDIGCGSGLFSLAARKLGAIVYSFDYDPLSVECTKKIKERYYKNDLQWKIEEGNVLEENYLCSLGTFDIIYSWGVLHHTGDMWKALSNIRHLSAKKSKLFLAIYNSQKYMTTYWISIKYLYNNFKFIRPFIISFHFLCLGLPRILLHKIKKTSDVRGMSIWYDLIDWLGGWPFQTAKPEEIFNYFKTNNYKLISLKTVGGSHGCNEFVFESP